MLLTGSYTYTLFLALWTWLLNFNSVHDCLNIVLFFGITQIKHLQYSILLFIMTTFMTWFLVTVNRNSLPKNRLNLLCLIKHLLLSYSKNYKYILLSSHINLSGIGCANILWVFYLQFVITLMRYFYEETVK